MPTHSLTHPYNCLKQIIGSEASYGPAQRRPAPPTREVVMWLGVQHQEKMALEVFAREVAPAGTGMAPGQTTLIGGRPKVYVVETDWCVLVS